MIDTHCHIDAINGLDKALYEAKEAGIAGIVAVGEDHESNQKILEIAKKQYPVKIYPALGLHPGKVNAENLDKTIGQIKENISKIVAIGETGLDFWIKPANKDQKQRELQIKSFKAQIGLANKYGLTISAHSRGAWQETLEIAQEEGLKKCIFHWYSGPLDVLDKLLKAGYCISATPSLEYSAQHIEAIKAVPLEKILIETDSPVTYKPNYGAYKARPKDLVKTLNALARIKQKTTEETAEICNKTAKELFKGVL